MDVLKRRIGITGNTRGVAELTTILRYFADTFPFENFDVLQENKERITKQFLYEKMLVNARGGLCYEINPLLYLFLQELGYDVTLVRGTVYGENGWATEGTHVLVIVRLDGKRYVVDSGFGSNIARQPLEIDGKAVLAPAGKFRVVQRVSEKGTCAYEKSEDEQWVLKYAFHGDAIAWAELDEVKQVITENKASAFNKQVIVSQCLQDKTYSINRSRLRVSQIDKEYVDTPFQAEEDLLQAVKEHTNEALYQQAKAYFAKK